MKLLLDTHTFIWFSEDDDALSGTARELIADTENQLFLSLVSVWEIQIKSQLGKVNLSKPLSEAVDLHQETNQLILLPISLTHILRLSDLKDIHRDPFDRLLIAQAKVESMVILTRDAHIKQYDVNTLW